MNLIRLLAATLLISGVGLNLQAQEIMKHPRVVELEDLLKESASEYVKSRFPSIPFMVTVRVDPVRREGASRNSYERGLPYFDEESDEEIKDEWDNPQVPIKALINRVKRITVSLSVPAKLRESDVNELKEGIFASLHLTPARDDVQIARRDWVLEEVPWLAIYAAAAVLIALLIGLLAINRTSANRIARALSEMKLGSSSAGSGNAGGAPLQVQDNSKSGEGERTQELTFNDPIKMKELAARHIQFLTASPTFPNHRDIFELDKIGKRRPEKLGAILAEFSAEMQSKLFAYSAGFHWVEALNEPGFLDFECLEVIQTLTQNPRKGDDLAWDHAVLAVWRLEEGRTQFVKSLPKDEAFALLADMPKAIAVHESRRSFPGAWAALLDPAFKAPRIPSVRIKEIEQMAIRLLALNQIEMVRRYRTERELLDYLKLVDPAEERDIYGALHQSSLVHRLRPPFYPVFDQVPEILQWLVPSLPIQKWALALFNLPKSDRAKVDIHLSEKQRFLLVEHFKAFDQNPPDRNSIGMAREAVGIALNKISAERAAADKVNQEIDSLTNNPEAETDEQKAA